MSAKLEEGNYKGAVRLVCSDETHAPASPATLLALRTKHPTAPADRRVVSGPSPPVSSTKFDESSVRSATLSFPAGSSAGPDGLTPQHLRDLIMIEGGSGPLLSALTGFLALVMDGSIPPASALSSSGAGYWPCSRRMEGSDQLRLA